MRLASAWSAVFLISMAVTFFAKAGNQFSNARLGTFYIVGLFILIASRRILFLLVQKWTREGRLTRRAVIVGGGEPGSALITAIKSQKHSDIEVIGVFDDRGNDRSGVTCGGFPVLGTVDGLT